VVVGKSAENDIHGRVFLAHTRPPAETIRGGLTHPVPAAQEEILLFRSRPRRRYVLHARLLAPSLTAHMRCVQTNGSQPPSWPTGGCGRHR
jgi:hypothetical protein